MMEPQDYRSHRRLDMAALIHIKAARILDVGCGDGTFAAGLQAEHGAEAWGLEPDPISARAAQQRLDTVWCSSWADAVSRLPDAFFDAIFFNDVLEHMIDPYQCLRSAVAKLAPGGTVYASIPNFLLIDNIATLIWTRDWQYMDAGILDRTHLRFYTKRSIERMFAECGYKLVSIVPLAKLSSWKWRLLNRLTFTALDDFLVLQYGVIAIVGSR